MMVCNCKHGNMIGYCTECHEEACDCLEKCDYYNGVRKHAKELGIDILDPVYIQALPCPYGSHKALKSLGFKRDEATKLLKVMEGID